VIEENVMFDNIIAVYTGFLGNTVTVVDTTIEVVEIWWGTEQPIWQDNPAPEIHPEHCACGFCP